MKPSSLVLALLIVAHPAQTNAATTDPEARNALRDYSICVAKHDPKESEAVLLSLIPNEEIVRRHPALVTPSCLTNGAELKMPGDYLRYGLAEAMVRREYAIGLPADILQAEPLEHYEISESDYQPEAGKKLSSQKAAELMRRRQDALAFQFLSIFGECVARKNPAGALQLILSKMGSSAETEAFAAISGPLSSCLMAGQKLALDRTALRGTIALNLFRLAKAPRLTTASK